MSDLIALKDLSPAISKNFEMDAGLISTCQNLNDLKEKLAHAISILLNRDMNRLLNIFYRMDLSEQKVNRIISESAPQEISSQLADLVIEREMQKAITRSKYKPSE
ncbi:MAG: hypothetical protein K2X86_11570 [Cytophagaceae bacterium]|nr:hypothetical protein [Cytophagaceae bacterium]